MRALEAAGVGGPGGLWRRPRHPREGGGGRRRPGGAGVADGEAGGALPHREGPPRAARPPPPARPRDLRGTALGQDLPRLLRGAAAVCRPEGPQGLRLPLPGSRGAAAPAPGRAAAGDGAPGRAAAQHRRAPGPRGAHRGPEGGPPPRPRGRGPGAQRVCSDGGGAPFGSAPASTRAGQGMKMELPWGGHQRRPMSNQSLCSRPFLT
mmetsp:Transcript_51837/g.160803  ORF Transcript_51837/g.160803 Transcript_51837/m.160803 type:complete len:207 (+) Transcript_51837:1236-1856(+)